MADLQWVLLGKMPADPAEAGKRWLWQLRYHIFAHIAGSPLNAVSGMLFGEHIRAR